MELLVTNRRKDIRYPLRARASFRWGKKNELRGTGKGWTWNISEHGAFIFSRTCPTEGASVDLTLRLPALWSAVDSSPRIHMELRGTVVRAECDSEDSAGWGFAVRSEVGFRRKTNGKSEPHLEEWMHNRRTN